ncbi:MAG: tRNA (uridine(34)/cytosine(34)/5-carboxymethylaminomethyluridine(34)-2'-O)-methyltransferase TrmL [Clostridia bacterium]
MNIVLVEPEIPQNTGNIARTCAATGAALHLIKPLGFEISDKTLKRAGLDYWNLLDVKYYENINDFFEKTSGGRYFYATTKAEKTYADVSYKEGDYILFGKETRGLPESLLKEHLERCVRIPMAEAARSLNLGNSVAVIVYEALRQNNFMNLKQSSNYLTEE